MNNGISRCGSGRAPGSGLLGGRKAVGLALTLALGLSGAACAPADMGDDALTERQGEITGSNGLALNGLALNGLALNGLALNGLALNGLALNGLALNGLALNGLALNGLALNGLALNGAFADWFNKADGGNTALHASVMKYVIQCALPAGHTASFTDANNATYTWNGQMGLAPNWGNDTITGDERQFVSACVMAHINSALPTPKQIQISLRGPTPALATTTVERQAVATFDGAFFGDLFSSPNKLYVCDTNWGQPADYYNTVLADWGRQCFHDPAGCNLFKRVECATSCVRGADGTYQSCTADGVTYKPITAFVPKMKLAREFSLTGITASTACKGCLDGRFVQVSTKSKAVIGTLTSTASEYLLDIRYSNPAKNKSGVGINSVMRMQVLSSTGAVVSNVLENGSADLVFPHTGQDVWKPRTVRVTLPANAKVLMVGSSAGPAPMVDVVSMRLP